MPKSDSENTNITVKQVLLVITILGLFSTISITLGGLLNAKADKGELIRVERQSCERDRAIKQDFKEQVIKIEERLDRIDSKIEKGFYKVMDLIKEIRTPRLQ